MRDELHSAFPFDECRDVLFRGLFEAFQIHAEEIRQLHKSEIIQAISFDVLPWDPYLGVAFRVQAESNSLNPLTNPADWKHSHFIQTNRSPLLRDAEEYIHKISRNSCAHDVDHGIFIAAAKALLDERIAAFLQSLEISAPTVTNETSWPRFPLEYIVSDDDQVITLNYCAWLHANRVTRRLGYPCE
jgi:hypothetical protein